MTAELILAVTRMARGNDWQTVEKELIDSEIERLRNLLENGCDDTREEDKHRGRITALRHLKTQIRDAVKKGVDKIHEE